MSKRFEESENYMDKVQDEVQAGESEAMDVSRNESLEEAEAANTSVQVDVDEAQVSDTPGEDAAFPPAHQVEPKYKIFVPFEDFEGRINQEDFSFKKGVAVKVTADQANTWLDAKKGYVK